MQGLTAGLTFSDRFTLVRRLGGGGMGEVWLADDRELPDRVALKLLDARFSESAEFVDLLRHECSQSRALVHPNIVRVFDFHAADDRYFISMQYIDGDTLIASRGVPFQKIVHQVLMVCDALAYAHRAGVIHRDVKPSNVLVDRNGVCYLTDFGLAAVISPANGADGVVLKGGGTLPSMSPQQLAGQPAAVADDVYSLGALLYELLSGAPLFHPDVTPERIRAESPAPLASDQAGQPLPDSLAKLVLAMLSKSPAQRPAGIGAVRSVLEEVHADFPEAPEPGADPGNVIRPVSRRVGSPGSTPATASTAPQRRVEETGKGMSPTLVYGSLIALLAVALLVVFLLPDAVDERRTATEKAAVEQEAARPTPAEVEETESIESNPAALRVKREIADEVLGELLTIEDRLRATGVDVWGDADWAEIGRLTEIGDDAYQDRRYDEAVANYRQALNLMKILEPRAARTLATALQDGGAAIANGESAIATQNYELALAIDPVNAEAIAGLERATHLDEVVQLTRQASALEAAGDLPAAADLYEQVLAIDPDWRPAREGLGRSRAGVAQLGYEKRMAAGFGALSRQEFDRARREFEAALAIRSGDPAAVSALRQVDTESRLAEVIQLQVKARIAETGEEWSQAADYYAAILKLDPAVTSAQQSLERARTRQLLGENLDGAIAKADQLNDDRVAQGAGLVLEQARAISSPGPVLAGQVAKLDELLRIAAIPVPVTFQSDNLTEVVIYKVGSLGLFQTRTVDLKPGRYVAVGSRAGYRDVRRNFQVSPQGSAEPIVLSCEEQI